MATSSLLRLKPARGKFLSVTINGHEYSIFEVDPRTNEYGTLVPHADAIAILSLPQQVASLVPQIDKHNNFVSQLSDTEKAALAETQAKARAGIPVEEKIADEDTGADKAAIEAEKAALAKAREDQEAELEAERAELAAEKAALAAEKAALAKVQDKE